jgi:hypothetical protein
LGCHKVIFQNEIKFTPMLHWNSLSTIGYAVIEVQNSLSATFKGLHRL